jgi:hypothetical protein
MEHSELESRRIELMNCLQAIQVATILKFATIDKFNSGEIYVTDDYRRILTNCENQLQDCVETIIGFIQF